MFGFGPDTDEVNGFEGCADGSRSPSSTVGNLVPFPDSDVDASDNTMVGYRCVLPLRKEKESEKFQHPIFRPSSVRCSYCRAPGHSLDFCPSRLEANQAIANKWCTQGWHAPKIHDDRRVWRCKFCATHLYEEYVWHWYPKECMEEEEKFFKHRLQVEKYMA